MALNTDEKLQKLLGGHTGPKKLSLKYCFKALAAWCSWRSIDKRDILVRGAHRLIASYACKCFHKFLAKCGVASRISAAQFQAT